MIHQSLKIASLLLLSTVLGTWIFALAAEDEPVQQGPQFAGTQNCRPCHENFYQLWAPSHHGLAMQPFSPAFAEKELTAHEEEIVIDKHGYRADICEGRVVESGPDEKKYYSIEHVLGGKNVYYFLTPLERGRLQTLPIAYDVRSKTWFDTAASGMRHVTDEPVDWRDSVYTFNTACYRCHVSQLSTNYDLESDTYNTNWAEPGINCETCHGPGEPHIQFCENLPEGEKPEHWMIKRGGSSFTVEQNNATCSTCHAKMMPLTPSFEPGDRFFDHYDLTTLEHPDFYPDGRDLGENYTYTLWLLNPCVQSGQLSCLHCHTSSGRFKQADDPNQACMPCHERRVKNATMHTRHKEDSPGNLCISCHMPMTEFARMLRSDHSMLPPTPAATLAFESPNACNICHTDQDSAWADQTVKEWHGDGYQTAALHRAGLIDAARKRNWTRLPDMLSYVESDKNETVFAASLIRLLRACNDPALEPTLLKAMNNPSPLVRGAAAESLRTMPTEKSCRALIHAAGDDFRLVRIRAAGVLAGFPPQLMHACLEEADIEKMSKAFVEFLSSHLSRPDHWTSHYNLGNLFLDSGDLANAVEAYETALNLEPRAVLTLVNASMGYARMGNNEQAEKYLKRALEIEPDSAAAHFNLGLLKAELNSRAEAEFHLRAALEHDPALAGAAYNLGILIAEDSPQEAVDLLGKAFELNPSPQYGYTQAFYAREAGDMDDACDLLNLVIEKWPAFTDAYLLLGNIYEEQGGIDEAEALYQHALDVADISGNDKMRIEMQLRRIKSEKAGN